MRKLFLSVFVLLPFAAAAQTISNFESPVLPKADTFFMRYDMPKKDIGINSGLAHFPLFTDTGSGYQYWDHGFTYSNVTDTISGGFGNQYAARTGKGVNGSMQYAVAYGASNRVILTGAAQGKSVRGFYATNGSYPYYSIKFGDGFARRFGDTTGTKSGLPQGSYPDYFRLVVSGYQSGVRKPDTVQFYLADYRFADSAKDYIVRTWEWVPLLKLGAVDSLEFTLQSSDTSIYGMNTPSYFCMDDFTTNETLGVGGATSPVIAKVFPNPAGNTLHVALSEEAQAQRLEIVDMSGRVVLARTPDSRSETLAIDGLPAGGYMLRVIGAGGQFATARFTKQ